jgi:hypothetical protein
MLGLSRVETEDFLGQHHVFLAVINDADLDREAALFDKARFSASPLPDRASRALWYHEYAVRTYYVEIRWVLAATELEAIVHVDQYHSTRQFKCRVSQLASELGVSGLGLLQAERAYMHRSTFAHGQKLGQLSDIDRKLYESMETTVRVAVLKAIEDDKFSGILSDPEKIKKRWPI